MGLWEAVRGVRVPGVTGGGGVRKSRVVWGMRGMRGAKGARGVGV